MKATILVADGSKLVTRVVAELVKRLGYRLTTTANSGTEALRAAALDPPDLALIDVHMTGEASGVDVAVRLRRMGTRVILLSGLPDERGRDIARRVGAQGILPKLFCARELRWQIEAGLAAGAEGVVETGS